MKLRRSKDDYLCPTSEMSDLRPDVMHLYFQPRRDFALSRVSNLLGLCKMFILREKPFLHPALTLNRKSQPVLSSPHNGLNQDSCTRGTLRSLARSRVRFVSSCFVRACVSCRCNSFMGNTAVQKKPQSKPKKPHLSGHKGGGGSREPQPKRLEEVYTALKQGLE